MTRKPDEDPDLALAEDLVFGQSGATLQRFTLEETLVGSTPDFRVLKSGRLAAFCEVKSPRDDWVEQEIEKVPAGQIAGGLRSDPIYNRLARHMQKAATQFDAVNASRTHPAILVFVNHDTAADSLDLTATIEGSILSSEGTRMGVLSSRALADHVSDACAKIDLFIWIDARARRVDKGLFTAPKSDHARSICELLGFDKDSIRRVR